MDLNHKFRTGKYAKKNSGRKLQSSTINQRSNFEDRRL